MPTEFIDPAADLVKQLQADAQKEIDEIADFINMQCSNFGNDAAELLEKYAEFARR